MAIGDNGYLHIAERPVDPIGQPSNAGARAQHMKRFNFDETYYKMWWDSNS